MTNEYSEGSIALLTNCTASGNAPPEVDIKDMPTVTSMGELLDAWVDALDKHKPSRTPGALYSGLSFDTVVELAQDLGQAHCYVVTGGHGLVSMNKKMVPYNFTHDKSQPHHVQTHITQEKFLPHIWWSGLNFHLYKSTAPISDLILKRNYKYIVGALPKGFIHYISNDLAQLSAQQLKEQVFIPLPASMMGQIPRAIRAAMVPYSTEFSSLVDSSRYNKPQRIVQKFLQEGIKVGLAEYAAEIHTVQGSGVISVTIDYDTMFEENLDVRDASHAHAALQIAKAKGLKTGGDYRFTGAWKGFHGVLFVDDLGKEESTRAISILQEIMKNTKPKSSRLDDVFLRQLGVFVEAARTLPVNTIFTAKEIAAWGKATYGDEGQSIKSASKIGWALTYYTVHLGLERIKLGGDGGYGYKVGAKRV